MWKAATKGKMDEYLDHFLDWAPRVHAFLGTMRIFCIPVVEEDRIRKRIESAIADQFYAQPDIKGQFQDDDIRYSRRWDTEEPIRVIVATSAHVHGLTAEFEA